MHNPFEDISRQLTEVKELLHQALIRPNESLEPDEYISEEELCKRFNITRPTVRRWAKEKKIPVLRFGSAKRYNWNKVKRLLEK